MTLGKLIHKYTRGNNAPRMKSLADFGNPTVESQWARQAPRSHMKKRARASKRKKGE